MDNNTKYQFGLFSYSYQDFLDAQNKNKNKNKNKSSINSKKNTPNVKAVKTK